MICKVCGTEIADKALICFRCGASTYEPVHREGGKRRGGPKIVPTILALIVLVVAALLMARAAVGAVPRTLGLVLLVLGVAVLLLQLLARRRR